MSKFILLIVFLIFLSCGKQTKEAKDQVIEPENIIALPIQKHASIPIDTSFSKKLSKKEIATIFTKRKQNQLDIYNTLYQAYSYTDQSNEHYVLLTDHKKEISEEKDTLYDNVYALILTNKNNQLKKKSTIKGEIDGDWETSIGFWNQYFELSDLDQDGVVDPIIVYGTTGQNGYIDGRVRIVAYHKKKRITIKHQNSEIPSGRITKINRKFYDFPIQIQKAVQEKMKLMSQNGHAVFAKNWEEDMKKKAIRLEKI